MDRYGAVFSVVEKYCPVLSSTPLIFSLLRERPWSPDCCIHDGFWDDSSWVPVLKEDSKAEWLITKPLGSKQFVRICLIQWFNHHLSLVRPACLVEARAAKKIRTSLAMQRHEQVRKLHCQWRMWRKSVRKWDDVKGSGIGQVQTCDVDCSLLNHVDAYEVSTTTIVMLVVVDLLSRLQWFIRQFEFWADSRGLSFLSPDHSIASPKHPQSLTKRRTSRSTIEPRSWQPRPLGHPRELKVSWDDSTWTLEVAFHLSLFFS